MRSPFVHHCNKRTDCCYLAQPKETEVLCNHRKGGCRIVGRQIGEPSFSPVNGAEAQPRCDTGDYYEKSEFTSVAAQDLLIS